ncbi:MAG: restriction endonuclease subunit S [Chthoniobacterales bacterium]
MKSNWQKLPFDEAVADESGGNLKTPQSEFLSEGKFAVVDQGKELVSGYVNDRTRLCRSSLPVVVFGDHTRCLKFVNFPFCMGADGIKVLRPKVEADVKYLYHFLRQLRLHDGGYDRHFKYLKRAEVMLPPLAEQRRIAEVLDRAEALRAKRRAALAQLDTLTQSLFLDLFGDPVTNPKQWRDSLTLSEVADMVSGITKGRKLNGEAVRETPYLAVANVQDKALNLTTVKTIEATASEIARYKLIKDDLLLTEGGDPDKLGRGTLWNDELPECIHQNHIFRVRLTSPDLDPLFLNWLVGSQRGKKYFLRSAKQTTGIASINMTQLRGFPLLAPPIKLQREFARRVTAVERMKTAHRASLAELDALFATLQHRAFRGEL